MQQYSAPPQVQIRKPILIFLKHVGPPVLLYVEDIEATYQELKGIITSASDRAPKLIEKIGKGPLKRLAVLDTQIAGIAIQEEPAV